MAARERNPRVLAIDAGGTMTDTFIVDDAGQFVVGKAQTTPEDESIGFMRSSEDALGYWDLEPGDEPSRGASLAMLGGAGGVAVLLVELAAGGVVAEHTTPDVSVCHVVEGGGTVFFPGGNEIAFERGDTIEFAGDVPHGWRGGSERTLLAVTTYPEDSGKAAA